MGILLRLNRLKNGKIKGHAQIGKNVLFCIAFLTFFVQSPALTLALAPKESFNQYSHRVWQTEDGLPHNSVNAVLQTKNGYLWLGTYEGLVRFDGVRFTVFNDIHNKTALWKQLESRVTDFHPDFAVLNGDIMGHIDNEKLLIRDILAPAGEIFRGTVPFFYARGNHETRGAFARELIPVFPWYMRLFFQLFILKSFSTVKDMKRLSRFLGRMFGEKGRRDGIVEYLEGVSRTDEHYIRIYENTDCWGFENVGTVVDSRFPPTIAGLCTGFEREEREWNAVETACIGLGDPYCEFKVVPGEIPELRESIQKDPSAMERIHERLLERLMGFLLDGRPLVEGRGLGADFLMHDNVLPMAGGERYRMALRMGGAKVGNEVGERLAEAGLEGDGAVSQGFVVFQSPPDGPRRGAGRREWPKSPCQGLQSFRSCSRP